ncbi:hypothetical protein HOP50_10g60420 [Chloropicon primus]|uniref:C2 domain-containing protein n=1 Tax=Chloropicon primus TaxID=1764295 RepID=A0A5B8MSL4_9CHLO|nr:hypothetical protein A3770_10p60210 [Chloropicon primus]UPR02715.1 hypothetical protein HOP50_10g60420 [Chloropicon primus]|eukprot:QDZ23503.1 hypothetical protein A3770_10p60210 [Chloropicon primus]
MENGFGEVEASIMHRNLGSWTLVVSGLRVCNLKLQTSRLVQELYATFTKKPKLFVQVWNQDTNACVAQVEVDGCQTSPVTNEMKWPGETSLHLGKVNERERHYVVFTLATRTKMSLGKHSMVTLASTKVNLDKVPRIQADEGAWFVEILDLKGTSCGPKSKLGVQLALMPTEQEEDGWFDLPDDSTTATSSPQTLADSTPEPMATEERRMHVMDEDIFNAEGVSEKIIDLLDEAWTAGTIGRSPSAAVSPESRPLSTSKMDLSPSRESRDDKALEAPLSIRIHLHKICDLHNYNFLSLAGNTSIYAVLHHVGYSGTHWKKSKMVPKSSTPTFNDIFEFHLLEPTSYITIAFVEEVHMPFSGMKERFRTSRLLGKIEIQPSCFPANKKCHLKMNLLSSKLIQRANPYVLVSVCLNYESLWQVLDVYCSPVNTKTRQLPVMQTMPDELKSLSTEDLMDLWSKSGDYSLTASITSARRTLRRAKNAKQEVDLILEPFARIFKFLQSWQQPVASILVLLSYCRLCLTPKYIPSVLLLVVAAVPLYQYQSNIQYSILFKSKFVSYKTWRVADTSRTLEGDDTPSGSPRWDASGEQEHLVQDTGEAYDDMVDEGSSELLGSSSKEQKMSPYHGETQSSNLRRRIKTVARISQEFSNNVALISSRVEKALHLVFWTDPRLSTMFVATCLLAAALLVVIPPNYIALLAGCYLMRPPQLRNDAKGVVMNLWDRLPDNSDTF